MFDYDSAAEKRTEANWEQNVDERTRKALTESVSICETTDRVKGADGLYEVFPCSGGKDDRPDTYVIDARRAVCECPDFEYREPEGGCKHVRRLKVILGVEEAPVEIPAEEISSQIGHGVAEGRGREEIVADRDGGDDDRDDSPPAGAPKAVVADGGEVVASAGPSETTLEAEPDSQYSHHWEHPDQGGEEFVRCEECGRELLCELGGADRMLHAEDCSEREEEI